MDQSGTVVHNSILKSEPASSGVVARIGRANNLVVAVMALLDHHKPSIVLVEGYAFASRGGMQTDRVEYGGLLRWHILKAGFALYEVVPTTLKKWATGAGIGDKTAVVAQITKRYGVTFKTNDEYDAYALARMGIQIRGWEQPANKPQGDSIKVVTAEPKEKKAKK